jgi:hypothetical protein
MKGINVPVNRLHRVIKRPRRGPPKVVVCAERPVGRGLKLLSDKLGEKLGYKVFRVRPSVVGRRIPVHFNRGLDKITQFQRFVAGEVAAPPHVLSPSDVPSLGTKRVVARRLINASEGRGITVFEMGQPVPPAPLYVGYIVKKKEFRVHVWNNEVIDVAEKRKRKGFEGVRDSFVRNVANGYVFCRADIVEPNDLRSCALSAVHSLGCKYGAVDVIWNEKQNKCFALEVNSRPGMEGTTLEKYADAILKGLGK